MNIYIDDREIYLKNKLNTQENIFIKHLNIGDIQYIKNNELVLVIERKTVKDLCSSVIDGRFREQKYRLLELKKKLNIPIIYIFEGIDYKKGNLPKNTILSCIINTLIRDNIFIIQSKNSDETGEYILKIRDQLTKINVNSGTNYNDILKFSKKKIFSTQQCFIAQLCQIPGISNKIAIAISNLYNNMNEFLKYLNNNDIKVVSKLQILPKRKLGPKLTKKIYHFLLNSI